MTENDEKSFFFYTIRSIFSLTDHEEHLIFLVRSQDLLVVLQMITCNSLQQICDDS